MKVYVYTDDGNGNHQIAMPQNIEALESIIAEVYKSGFVVKERHIRDSQEDATDPDVRFVTVTPEELSHEDFSKITWRLMDVMPTLKVTGRVVWTIV